MESKDIETTVKVLQHYLNANDYDENEIKGIRKAIALMTYELCIQEKKERG